MSIRKIPTQEAVGKIVPHDLTKAVPDGYKGPAFRKGHLITQEDIPHLLDIGKAHLNVIDLGPDELHEDQAIERLAKAIGGPGLHQDPPSEGRINLRAAQDGLAKIKPEAVDAINGIQDAVVSTIHSNQMVRKGDLVAAVKVVPLVVKKGLAEEAEAIAARHRPVAEVKALKPARLGLIIVAGEVYSGRIVDRFGPVLRRKAAHYGLTVAADAVAPDDEAAVSGLIESQIAAGAQIVIAAGGMSVDADDITPAAIRGAGAEPVIYGTPVLPGGMFMLAYKGEVPVMGLPACGMTAKNTILDMALPRILTGEALTRADFTRLGYGGLCRKCEVCHFENCTFGRR